MLQFYCVSDSWMRRKLGFAILYIIFLFVSYIQPFVIHSHINLLKIIYFEIFEIKMTSFQNIDNAGNTTMKFGFTLANFCESSFIVVIGCSCMKRSYNCQLILIFAWKYLVFAINALSFVVSRVFLHGLRILFSNHGPTKSISVLSGVSGLFFN